MQRMAGLLSVAIFLSILVEGCASFTGYPRDYQNEAAILTADAPYLKPDVRTKGDAVSDTARGGLTRREYRDTVVYRRIEVIDSNYYKFEAALTGTHSGTEIATDLTALVLNGLGAVTGSAGTKAALAAASGGVVGAKGVINTDLFYQKTIQSLIAQMRAARAQILFRIEAGLRKPVSAYSIDAALNDVNAYYIAGTLPSAIALITANAGSTETKANKGIDALRQTEYTPLSTTGRRLTNWLFPDGDQTKAPNPAKLSQLNKWMKAYKQDPRVQKVPYALFLRDPKFESDRAQAVVDLKIP